jgi:sec-independent protein translocase protein TatA
MGLDNPVHIAILLVILLLVFGAKRLPEMGHSLGAGLRGFKESISGETPSSQNVEQLPAATPAPVAAQTVAAHTMAPEAQPEPAHPAA